MVVLTTSLRNGQDTFCNSAQTSRKYWRIRPGQDFTVDPIPVKLSFHAIMIPAAYS